TPLPHARKLEPQPSIMMRDWSLDVCASDLEAAIARAKARKLEQQQTNAEQIGRASCREKVL
ncbi:hypothetical protein ACAG01_24945, partial [Escherichia coli]